MEYLVMLLILPAFVGLWLIYYIIGKDIDKTMRELNEEVEKFKKDN